MGIHYQSAINELHRLQQRQLELQKNFGLYFYKPSPKQDLFHRAGKKRYRYLRAGNRFGKSWCGAAEDSAHAVGFRPWYPVGDPARTVGIPQDHPSKIIIVTQDWDKATEIFTCEHEGSSQGKLFKFLPKDQIEQCHRNRSGHIDIIRLKNGSSIFLDTIKSFMQDGLSQESSDWDFAHIDEPCPKKMYVAIARGLVDRNGQTIFTLTPLSHGWINDMFVPRSRQRDPELVIDEGDKWMITARTEENPTLTQEAINAYSELIDDPATRLARLTGIPLELSGMIYPEFNYDDHRYDEPPEGWKAVNDPPKDYTIRYAIDPHPRLPHAVLFAATGPHGSTWFYDELFVNTTGEGLIELIKEKIKGRFVVDTLCDPLAYTTDPSTKMCLATDLVAGGLFIRKAVKDPMRGIIQTKAMLKKPGLLKFSYLLRETLKEFEYYHWKEETQKPADEDDHMMENLYRLVLSGLAYVEPDNNMSGETFGFRTLNRPAPLGLPRRSDDFGEKIDWDKELMEVER